MAIVCDSSTLISLADTCLLWTLKDFSKKGTDFFITEGVRYETVDHPLQIKRFEFEAYKISKLVEEGYLKVLNPGELKEKTAELIQLSNRSFYSKHGPVQLIHEGEAEVLVMSELLDRLVAIDEKTTRLIIESPALLRDILEEKMGERIRVDGQLLRKLQDRVSGIRVIRSVDIAAVAFERGFMDRYGKGKEILNAVLWALRKSGCSVTKDEIDSIST